MGMALLRVEVRSAVHDRCTWVSSYMNLLLEGEDGTSSTPDAAGIGIVLRRQESDWAHPAQGFSDPQLEAGQDVQVHRRRRRTLQQCQRDSSVYHL